MYRTRLILVSLAAAAALAGCAKEPGGAVVASVPAAMAVPPLEEGRSAAIPWQLTPASTASRAQGEETVLKDVPGLGRVRGTTVALAQIGRKMVPFPSSRVAVDACEKVMAPQAVKEGAYSVEAAPAGPLKKSREGKSQQVLFRILYKTQEGVEVRQHALVCTIGGADSLVSVKPI